MRSMFSFGVSVTPSAAMVPESTGLSGVPVTLISPLRRASLAERYPSSQPIPSRILTFLNTRCPLKGSERKLAGTNLWLLRSALKRSPFRSESLAVSDAEGAFPPAKLSSVPISAFESLKSGNPEKSIPRFSDEALTLRLP